MPCVQAYTGQRMPLALSVNGLDDEGVRLISPASPDFDDLARPLMGERVAHIGLQLKPMLVIVTNDSPHTIVSMSVVWHVTHEGGRTSRFWGHASFPESVCGDVLISHDPEAIPPGSRRLEANGLVLHGYGSFDEYYDQFLPQFVDRKNEDLADGTALQIDLNAVIFADGTLIGPDDESRLADLFSTYVRAKQDWYRGIIDGLDAGQSVEDAFGAVRTFLEQSSERHAGMASHFSDPQAIWKQQSAAEAASWRRRFKDEEIPGLLRAAIRLTPFVIHRRGASPAKPTA
jgi:hypothetical protein